MKPTIHAPSRVPMDLSKEMVIIGNDHLYSTQCTLRKEVSCQILPNRLILDP